VLSEIQVEVPRSWHGTYESTIVILICFWLRQRSKALPRRQ